VLYAADNRQLSDGPMLTRTRDFYGVVSVWETQAGQGKGVMLVHGGIMHGHQYRRFDLRATPTTYYYPATGVGRVLGEGSPLGAAPRRVAAVGLGTGSIAAYARPGDEYRFYEISPNVLRLAKAHFTYLKDATDRGAKWDAVIGDARLTLAAEPPDRKFDVLVLDAFSGDAVPVHLLTLEAFERVYKPRLAPDGVVAVHLSNRFLRLAEVVAAAGRRMGWHVALHRSKPNDAINSSAEWVLFTPDAARAEQLLKLGAGAASAALDKVEPWTDERANVLGVVRGGRMGR
jgi:SAM-dependent methyltransferase